MLRHDFQVMNGARVPFTMLTGSESNVKVRFKYYITTDKRLMVYIRASCESYNRGDIIDVGCVRSAHNFVDVLTKFSKGQTLVDFMDTGLLTT